MKFAQPIWLFVGLIACASLLWRYRGFDARQRAELRKFASESLIAQLTTSVSSARRRFKCALVVAGIACAAIALARPLAGFRWEETKRKGLDLLLAVDTSKSMLAQDVKPDRLTRARMTIEDLVARLDGDRVGLLAFAGNAFLQCPLTLDYDAFRQSLDAVDTRTIPRGGTDIASAIREADAALDGQGHNERLLVLLTDGEDLEGSALEAARTAAKHGLKIFTVGVGSPNGELIPVADEKGETRFVRDGSGQFVKSRLDESMLRQIADPITLKVKLSGSGNFDRASAPALERNNEWKTYKPTTRFEAEDTSGCSGARTSEQALIPMQSGKLVIPALAFSYFDPETKQYATRSTQPLSVDVAPGQMAANNAPASPPPIASTVANPSPEPDHRSGEPALAPNRLVPGRFHATLRPWFFNPWAASGALLPSLGLLATYCYIRRRQALARDPRRVRLAAVQHAVHDQLGLMKSAAARGATSEFFAAARGALQNQLGLRLGLIPQAITLAEVNTRLNGEADRFRFVFELADEVAYTGRTFAAIELQKWYQVINAELQKLRNA